MFSIQTTKHFDRPSQLKNKNTKVKTKFEHEEAMRLFKQGSKMKN